MLISCSILFDNDKFVDFLYRACAFALIYIELSSMCLYFKIIVSLPHVLDW